MKEFVINKSRLKYLDVGNGPVVVLGHSFLHDHTMWQPQIDFLKSRYRIIAPDLWSHGASDQAPTNHLDVYDYANNIWDLLQSLKIKRFSVLGLSVGGMWATKLALMHPQHIDTLGIFASHVGTEPENSYGEYEGLFNNLKQLGQVTEEFAQKVVPFFYCPNTFTHAPHLPKALGDSLKKIPKENIGDICKLGMQIFKRTSLMGELKNITVPTFFVVGKQDAARPPSESLAMHQEVKNSEIHIIDNAGHIVNQEQSKLVNQIIDDFLTKHVKN